MFFSSMDNHKWKVQFNNLKGLSRDPKIIRMCKSEAKNSLTPKARYFDWCFDPSNDGFDEVKFVISDLLELGFKTYE